VDRPDRAAEERQKEITPASPGKIRLAIRRCVPSMFRRVNAAVTIRPRAAFVAGFVFRQCSVNVSAGKFPGILPGLTGNLAASRPGLPRYRRFLNWREKRAPRLARAESGR
jgi:hypothetical protein